MSSVTRMSWLRITVACLVASPASAQVQSASHRIRWWEVAVVAATIGAVSAADHGVDTWVQDHRSTSSDNLARVFRHGGQPEITFAVPVGILAAGVIGGRKDWQRSGARVLLSVVLAGLTTGGIKEVTGRIRPVDATNQYLFRPFSHHDSFPSGHTTMAFALASALGDELHRPWATALLHAAAAGTGWSRPAAP